MCGCIARSPGLLVWQGVKVGVCVTIRQAQHGTALQQEQIIKVTQQATPTVCCALTLSAACHVAACLPQNNISRWQMKSMVALQLAAAHLSEALTTQLLQPLKVAPVPGCCFLLLTGPLYTLSIKAT